ncbi:hypothetical protein HJC23_013447 [Cyclotella cryptica]|uniref:ER membrane protein complex subunit 1 n=1 Tax=Cyclotella cryptica TaxID=29204 RepID=A0ABD3P0H7_9STRA|eukprot:CCRYP_018487-RA/>CCRYP_018487-RA protein AED:0.01 eAED:0.01 QI:118/1/1/1/1/1/2/408/1192
MTNTTLPLLFLLSLLTTLLSPQAAALHADEAGLTDFLLRTPGHGHLGVQYGHPLTLGESRQFPPEVVWITSESGAPVAIDGGGQSESARGGQECWVAARNVTDGNVIWRADACSSGRSGNRRHVTLATGGMVHTLDNVGILRGWKVESGLIYDVDVIAQLNGLVLSSKEDAGDDKKSSRDSGYILQTPRLLSADVHKPFIKTVIGTVVTRDKKEYLLMHHSATGEIIHSSSSAAVAALPSRRLLNEAKVKPVTCSRILDLVSNGDRMGVITGHSTENEITLSSMAYTEIRLSSSDDGDKMVYETIHSVPLKTFGEVSSTPLVLSTVRVFTHKEKVYVMGFQNYYSKLIVANFDMNTGKGNGKIISMSTFHPELLWFTSITVEDFIDSGVILRVAGMDGKLPDAYRMDHLVVVGEDQDGGVSLNKVSTKDEGEEGGPQHEALVYCPLMSVSLTAASSEDGTTVVSSYETSSDLRTWSQSPMDGETVLVPPSRGGTSGGIVEYAHLVECKSDSMTGVFTARGGLTIALRVEKNGSSLVLKQLWSTEEALGSISSAVFLDETHAVTMSDGSFNADDEEETALRNLQFSNRIQSQLSSLKNFFVGGGILSSVASMALMSEEKKAERDYAFGFAKISVLLSESMHRIIALDTAKKGKVVWAMNLHPDAESHKIVHGGQISSLNDPHGYGGVHDHELLVLSYVPSTSSIEWKCFDGMTGRIFSNGAVTVSSKIAQIVPLRSSIHHPSHESISCRQVALIVHENDTVSVVPDNARSHSTVDEAISAPGRNGLFVHTVNKQTGEFHAMRVARKLKSSLELGSKAFKLVTVGTALFDPSQEKIVNVAHPQRGEVIQSPSTVLGDDALLLKYLNPHLVVVVTEATKSFLAEISPVSEGGNEIENSFYKSLTTSDGGSSSGQKRKPLGASKPGEAPPSTTSTLVPSLFVTLLDSVSGQILYRVSHAHATESDLTEGVSTKVPVIISENWVVYTFFNQRTRRTDIGVLTLHEGMIDKNGLTAFNGPEQELVFSSLESPKPIVLSKTYGMAKAITAIGVTVTKAGITSKQFLFATANDQVISMDRRLMDPRRPNGELKPSEKMEGLVRYAPLLPIIPLRTPSHVYQVSNVQSISSTAANVESQSLMLAYGGPDVFFSRLAPSKGFDLLPDDFNRGLLTVVVLGMTVLLVAIQRMNKKKLVTTAWL